MSELPEKRPSWARRMLPFATAAVLVGYTFQQIDLGAFRDALRRVDTWGFAAVTVVSTLALLCADALAIGWVYRTYVCPLTFRQAVVLRGASYLPQLLNYHVGQAWMAWFAARIYHASIARVTGATLLTYATTLGGVVLLACLSFAIDDSPMPGLGLSLIALGVAALAYLLTLAFRPRFLVRWRPVQVLLDAGVSGNLKALALRLPHVAVLFIGMWVPFGFFGVNVPLADALVCIPVLMLIGALPLTPQGLGTRDAVAIRLLAEFAPPEAQGGTAAIAAATLCWAIGMTLVHCVISPLLMRSARRMLVPSEVAHVQNSPHG